MSQAVPKKAQIACVLQNIIQYYALAPLLKYIREKYSKDWQVDVFVYEPSKDADEGLNEIKIELTERLVKDGFKPADVTKCKGKAYTICLAPYQNMIDIKYKYLLGYYYGSASSKPFTMSPDNKRMFHGMLLHSTYDASILSVYCQTYLVPNLRITEKKTLDEHEGKPVVLFLPTYGENSNSEDVSSALKAVKNDYYIIIKGHHGTNHLSTEGARKEALAEVADEYYDSTADINELFKRADVVLSDNSGAIFDAMYAGIPVGIVAKEINQKFGGVNTLQSSLVKDKVLPYTDCFDEKNLRKLLSTMFNPKTASAQKNAAKQLFPVKTGGAKKWVEVLEKYTDDKVDANYIALHDYLVRKSQDELDKLHEYEKDFYQYKTDALWYKKETERLQEQCLELDSTCQELTRELQSYRNGKLYKMATKVYNGKNKLTHRKDKKE